MTDETGSVTLTPAQIRCLLVGPWNMGFELATYDLAITQDKDKWVMVEDARNVGEEGSGVLVSPNGIVHYSGPSTKRTDDPWPVRVLWKSDREIHLKATHVGAS